MNREKEFLSTISHEIRTPLTSIKGFSKTILDSYDNLDDTQKKKFIKIIFEQSQRLINLIENALAAADSDENYINFVFKKVDINKILEKCIMSVDVNYKNITFNAMYTPNLFCTLDTDKLEQIFTNILDNACKYTVNSDKIDIKTYSSCGKNFISVKNFGSFIPKENQSNIFNKFYRIENYLTSKVQGSGLGLYIAKLLADKMNGNISIKSEEYPVKYVELTLSFPVFEVEDFMERSKNV